MKKLLIIAILSFAAFPLLGVNFQVTNNKGSQVSLTIKNKVATDAEHADDADTDATDNVITYYRAGEETLAGPTNIANDATVNFDIPNADQNLVPSTPEEISGKIYEFIAIVQWDENEEHRQTKALFVVFDIPNFTPRNRIDNDGSIAMTAQSYDEFLFRDHQNRLHALEEREESGDVDDEMAAYQVGQPFQEEPADLVVPQEIHPPIPDDFFNGSSPAPAA